MCVCGVHPGQSVGHHRTICARSCPHWGGGMLCGTWRKLLRGRKVKFWKSTAQTPFSLRECPVRLTCPQTGSVGSVTRAVIQSPLGG